MSLDCYEQRLVMAESPRDRLISASDNSGAQDEKNNPVKSTTSSSSAMRQLSQENVLSNLRQIVTKSVYPNDSLRLKSLEELFRNEVFHTHSFINLHTVRDKKMLKTC